MKPFDLDAALKGAPVRLRDGAKAFVRYHERDLQVSQRLVGWGMAEKGSPYNTPFTWDENGRFWDADTEAPFDIMGMWEEKPLTFDYWGAIQPKWKYLAQDKNGKCYFYTHEPLIEKGAWSMQGGSAGEFTSANTVVWDTQGRDWTDTLVGRPE